MGVRVKLSATHLTRYLATADEWVSTVLRGIWRAFVSGAAMYGATMYGYSNLEDLQSYAADWARQPMNRHRSGEGPAGEANHDQLTERVRKLELAAVTTAEGNCTSPIRFPNLAQATLCSITAPRTTQGVFRDDNRKPQSRR